MSVPCLATAQHGWRCWARPLSAPPPSALVPSARPARAAARRRRARARLARADHRLLPRVAAAASLHGAQRTGATVLRPFEVGRRARRAARSATRTAGSSGLVDAKAENEKLRHEVDAAPPAGDREPDRGCRRTRSCERCSTTATARASRRTTAAVAARVIAQPPTSSTQQIVIVAAGSDDGVRERRPGRHRDGLVGQVTQVASTPSHGDAAHRRASSPSPRSTSAAARPASSATARARASLILDRVAKDEVVKDGDTVVTAGLAARSGSSRSTRAGSRSARSRASARATPTCSSRSRCRPFVDFSARSTQ